MLLVFLSSAAHAQKSISDLPPAQASALKKFLSEKNGLVFLSEDAYDQGILKDMRKNFGARLKPSYRSGDFNRDGVQDFAVILLKEGSPPKDQGAEIAESHRYLRDVTVVIFNGTARSYKPVFVKATQAPLLCFLNLDYGKRLTFSVYETDEGFIMRPVRTGYRLEYPDH
ncbi:MAG TPA: hypothetical protein VJV03_13470 [Pyrinomonadaceae bacterium]|nr:hypothetical protein [Pyrinomonadaceae bacterium]